MSKQQFTLGSKFSEDILQKSLKKRIQLLDGIAYRREEGNYTRTLDAEEIAEAKSKLAESAIRTAGILEEKKEIMSEFKDRVKEQKIIHDEHLNSVKYGSKNAEGSLFLIDDQEKGIMSYFDDRGICVSQRNLKPEERQAVMRMGIVENE
jgi:hypothetical protein